MKYALVTGGSRGLGRAICKEIASLGIPVIVNYQSNSAAAQQVKDDIEAAGGEAELMQFDVADKAAVDAAIDQWDLRHAQVPGGEEDYIAYLVNNAGIRKDNTLFMMSDDDWHSVIDITVNGFYYVTSRLITKMMMRKHGGRIVNMASLSGLKGLPGQTNYSAAKAAVIGATKALAQEVAARNITVNAVAPGFIETDMTKDLPEDEMKQMIPMKRFGKPEEVAKVVRFLLSDDASYITGEVISINGGLYT